MGKDVKFRFRTIHLLILLLAGAVVWWIQYFPFSPDRLYDAVPAESVYVSEHDRLSGRWKDIIRMPAIVHGLQSAGVSRKELADLENNEAVQMILDRFGADKTLLAYTPGLYPGGAPALMLASWAGREGLFLRWGIYEPILGDFERCRFSNGRNGWRLKEPVEFLGENLVLSMAVSEGVLLGCLSRDPESVQALMHRVERRPLRSEAIRTMLEHGESNPDTLDRGWVRLGRGTDPAGSRGWHFALRFDGQERAAGWVRGDIPPSGVAQPGAVTLMDYFSAGAEERAFEATDELKSVLGDVPAALTVFPFGYARAAADEVFDSRTAAGILSAVGPFVSKDSFAFACMTSPAYSARIFEVLVPSVLVGVRLDEANSANTLMTGLIDFVNARYQLGLMPKVSSESGHPVVSIDRISGKTYKGIVKATLPAFTVLDNWLVIASSKSVLEKLIVRRMRPGADQQDVVWAAEMGEVGGDLMTWLDFEQSSSALKKFMGVYDLYQLVSGKRRRISPVRQNLEWINGIMSEMQAMNSLCVWSDLDNNRLEFRFLLGGRRPG